MKHRPILLIEDSHAVLCALTASLGAEFSAETLPLRHPVAPFGVRDQLQARLHEGSGRHSTRSALGNSPAAIGINAHLAVSTSMGVPGGRSRCHGAQLLEWLRRDRRSTIPVVLWSFLDQRRLALRSPILGLGQGLVFLPLPATLADFAEAFRCALQPTVSLDEDELEEFVVAQYGQRFRSTNPLQSLDPTLRRTTASRLPGLDARWRQLRGPLLAAVAACRTGEPADLRRLVSNPPFQELLRDLREFERSLWAAGTPVDAVTHASRRGIALMAALRPDTSGSTGEDAAFYREAVALLGEDLSLLADWAAALTLKETADGSP